MTVELRGPALARPRRLEAGTYVLGRDPACDVVIDGEGVSRRHVRLTVGREGTVRVEDLGSANGTRVQGQRHGDELRVPFELLLGASAVTVMSPGTLVNRTFVIRAALLIAIGLMTLYLFTDGSGEGAREQAIRRAIGVPAVLPPLDTSDPTKLALRAAAWGRAGAFTPGALGLAMRAWGHIAEQGGEQAEAAAAERDRLAAMLSARISNLRFEATRALRVGDLRTARLAATRLYKEAESYDLGLAREAADLLHRTMQSGARR